MNKCITQSFCYIAVFAFGSCSSVAETITLRGPETQLSDFPVDVLKRPPAGLDDAAYEEWLKGRPALIFEGTTVRLGRQGVPLSLSIQASSVEIKQSQIITYGGTLQISALEIVSDGGSIKAFDAVSAAAPEVRDGVPGQSGFSGGRVVLRGALAKDSHLDIQLNGQDGGQGGQGRAGQPGGSGSPGARGADHLFDCARGGGAGGQGQQGQTGEMGAPGGNGGDGGTLVLEGRIALQINQISISYDPGAPGPGGIGGIGGLGGPGGPGGGGSTYCRGGPPGPSGPPGNFGPPGPPGAAGRRGQTLLSPY